MADVDIDQFGEHNKTEEPTDENSPLDPVTPGGSTWDLSGSRALRAYGNQHANSKRLLEEESLKEPNS